MADSIAYAASRKKLAPKLFFLFSFCLEHKKKQKSQGRNDIQRVPSIQL